MIFDNKPPPIDAFVADSNGRDVGEIMVRENHARPYGGGKRDGWCDLQGGLP